MRRFLTITRLLVAMLAAVPAMAMVHPALAASCNGKTVTMSGSGTINGTPGNDVILGSSKGDLIYGKGGNDTICAGAGNDKIVLSGIGTNYVRGNDGNDDITRSTVTIHSMAMPATTRFGVVAALISSMAGTGTTRSPAVMATTRCTARPATTRSWAEMATTT